jgi:hypothetical protein
LDDATSAKAGAALVKSWCKENFETECGLEPIDPVNPPQMNAHKNVTLENAD